MNKCQEYRLFPGLRGAEDLGIAYLGSPYNAIAAQKQRIDRAEYGLRLAKLDGGVFSSMGYIVPDKEVGITF